MKRWLMILSVAVLLLLTGCDRSQHVGICFRDCDDVLTAQYRQSLEAVLTDAGYTVTVMDAGNDQSRQDRQVAELIEKKTDILILEPVMTSALDSVVEQAREGDVPVVLVNRQPEDAVLESWDRLCFVGYDAAQPGLLQGQLVEALPQKGDLNGDGVLAYAVIAGPEDHLDARLRTQSCTQALPQDQCLAVEYGDWTREDARRRCAKLLAEYGKDIEVIFCNSDELALGAMDAIADGGRTVGENVYLYGIDGQRQALFLIRSGDLTGTVSLDVSAQIENVVSAVQDLLRGDIPQKVSYVNHIAVDANNVEDYID